MVNLKCRAGTARRWNIVAGSGRPTFFIALVALFTSPASPAPKVDKKNPNPAEEDYYKIIQIPIPSDVTLECGGMEFLPDGTLAVSTRRGDIYFVEKPLAPNVRKIRFVKWATGMHEVMGLAYNQKNGYLYAIQRGEITRLKDTDGRGRANVYETFCDDWGTTGDYHEYPWMSKFDKDGNLWV